MCRIAKIDRFLADWPGAEFGPAHIVLSDANINDSSIDWCLNQFDSPMYADDDPAELRATREWLENYRALPYDQRIEPGDTFCPEMAGGEPVPADNSKR